MAKIEESIRVYLLLILILSAFRLFASNDIVLNTLEWEPYIGSNLPNYGFIGEIVETAFRRKGYNPIIRFYPWARAVELVKAGKADGFFPEYYSKDYEKYIAFSVPLQGGPVVFFKRKEDKITYKKYIDLRKYRIGVVRSYVNEYEFDLADYLQKDISNDDYTNINKLIHKRIDLFVADRYVGEYLIKKNFPEYKDKIDFLEKPLINHKLYVCISLKHKNYKKVISDFNLSLTEMEKDGSLRRIMKKHGYLGHEIKK
jgi:ABC-type amino acid transport substrate-binding protein